MVKSHNKQMARDLFRQFELYVLGRQKDAAVRDLVLEPRIKLTKVQTIYESDYPQPIVVERSWVQLALTAIVTSKKPAIDSAADSALPIHVNHGICRCFLTRCVVGRRLSFEQCSVRSRFSTRLRLLLPQFCRFCTFGLRGRSRR